MNYYENCQLCPRQCHVDRRDSKGVCQTNGEIVIARAALHFWEEPCISGENGSGAVFFSGCPLHCVFCQNEQISWGQVGKKITEDRLADIFLELQDKGANNINLVTGTHFIPSIVSAVELAKQRGLVLPVIYNSSGYETVDSLKMLEGIVDVYLPDFKYMDNNLAQKYSKAKDYPDVAKKAIEEMYRQCPKIQFNEDGYITSGVIVRQLLLPGHVNDSKRIIEYIFDKYKDDVYLSLMSQFTPMGTLEKYPEINRRVTKREYNSVVDYAIDIGVKNAFIQDRKVADESFIPEFDGEGI